MSDYPLGAKYDKRAPYNEKPKKVSVCVSVTYHKDIELEIWGDYDEVTLEEKARQQLYHMHKFMDDDYWIEDEFVVIEE